MRDKSSDDAFAAFELVLQNSKHLIEKTATSFEMVFGTPLMFAVNREKNADLYVKALLDAGANIDFVANSEDEGITNRQYTALMLAAEQGKLSTVKLLLEYKPDLNLVNSEGKTALDLAANDEIKAVLEKAANAGK